MYDLVLLMCMWRGATMNEPDPRLVCNERVLAVHRADWLCDAALSKVRTDGRDVTIYCRPRPLKVEK